MRRNTVIVQSLLDNHWKVDAVDEVSYSWVCIKFNVEWEISLQKQFHC